MSRLGRSFSPLRERRFALLFGGQLTSNLGDACYAVALPWYVLAGHGGALLLGTVLAAYGISRIALLAVGGHASDRFRPWTVMMVADLARGAATLALAVVAGLRPPSAWILVPIAVVLGAGSGLFMPGSFAIVPSLLGSDALEAGNALTAGGTELATLVGPAGGGALVAFLGAAPAFGLDAGTFLVSAATLAGIRILDRRQVAGPVELSPATPPAPAPEEPPAPEAPPSEDERSLLDVLRSERFLQVVLVVVVAANLGFGGAIEVALPALVRGPLHAGAEGYGAVIAALGGGGLLGTILAGQLGKARRPAVVGSVAFLVEGACFSAIGYVGGGLVAVGALFGILGVLNGFGNIVMITAFQRWSPPHLIGRLMGLVLMASFGSFPVSVLAGGAVVRSFGPRPFFPAAGVMLIVAIAFALTQRSWRSFAPVPDEPAPAPAP